MEDLPQHCNYQALGAARIREIKAIVSRLDNCEHGGRAFQKLPRHMQRRAVSSNPRRLPRYLREKHMREGGDNVKSSRRPSRKYRRRPSNLLQEYNRRSREHVWLETHIWHAKRFHMQRQWGYALPHTPTCRGHRASLRAATTGCLLQDVSYLCCIELEGARSTLLPGLSRAMQPEGVGVLTQPLVMAGRQWMSCMLFQPGRQPHGAITEVDILFHPPHHHSTDTQEDKTKLWLWTHPSSYSQVVGVLKELFQLEKVVASDGESVLLCSTGNGESQGNLVKSGEGGFDVEEIMECKEEMSVAGESVSKNGSEGVSGKEVEETMERKEETYVATGDKLVSKNEGEDVPDKDEEGNKADKKQKQKRPNKPKDVHAKKLETRNIPFERTPKYISGDKHTTMTLLKDTLNRFKLVGPKSYSVLSSALLPSSVEVKESEIKAEVDETSDQWWKQYYGEAETSLNHQKQVASWKQLASCPHPPTPSVLPLTVRDPRVSLPAKKVPMEDEESGRSKQVDLPDWPVVSPLYSSDIRDQVTLSREPDAVLNKRRSQFLVPGTHMPETPQEARLPLVLLSRPSASSSLGEGWEVVAPAGWGMSVFLPLVFHGAVVAGQHEAENLHLEALTSLPSHLLPDTPAGSLHSTWISAERRKEFFKRPPASRPNFIKFGVQFPFSTPWHKLLQEWQPGTSDLYVLRDSRLISCLSSLLENAKKKSSGIKENVSDDSSTENKNYETAETTNSSTASNGDTSVCTEGVCPGKRKAEDELTAAETKRAKQEHLEGETQQDKLEGEKDGTQELEAQSPGCLVMVVLVVPHKGTLDSCSMVCLPKEEDFLQQEKDLLKPREAGEAPTEPPHEDPNHDQRRRMREEHMKIQAMMKRKRQKARQKVAKKMDIVSSSHSSQTVKEATAAALNTVEKENEVIIGKCLSYKEEMEHLWLMGAREPLQCCARLIMGYTTHGTFSHTHGRAAGIGWVALKPLLDHIQLCRKHQSRLGVVREVLSRGGGKACLPVLVRNPNSAQYRWAQMSVVEKTC